jgi:hypothetical protein
MHLDSGNNKGGTAAFMSEMQGSYISHEKLSSGGYKFPSVLPHTCQYCTSNQDMKATLHMFVMHYSLIIP